MGKLVYMLNEIDSNDTICVATNKRELYLEMKADIFRREFEDCYTKDYIKKNMPFFEYTSNLLPREIQNELEQYSILETELKGTLKAVI
ncbi:hypothetical protein [Staphylococcus succinus]|uniref:hypothetical protein n=1 Tax=Staphylococcus succinus TaxID=61015 RepID=UPI000E695257|nr:hypothetical protein [Staphylococcus succinus]RIN23969.1 hypothetical protein BU067_10830 [Staphylococcus succinus]